MSIVRTIGPPRPLLVFLVTVAAHALATSGRALISSDTRLYVKLADGFLARDFSGTFTLGAVRWTKSVYLVLLAAARAIAPVEWPTLMVVLNVACSGVLALLLVDLTTRACRSSLASWTALFLYAGCFELFRWMAFVVTDLPFALAAFVPFYYVGRRLIDPSEPFRPFALSLSLLVASFTRPPGAVLIPLTVFAERSLVRGRPRRRAAIAAILMTAVAALMVRTLVVHDPHLWPSEFAKPKIEQFAAKEKRGEVVFGRKETMRTPPQSRMDHVIVVGDRFARFFQVTSTAYSRSHNLVNALYFLPLYGLGLIGIVRARRSGDRARQRLVIAIVVWLSTVAWFYALTILDSEWRYRAPFMPQFILLAACGVDALPSLASRRTAAGA